MLSYAPLLPGDVPDVLSHCLEEIRVSAGNRERLLNGIVIPADAQFEAWPHKCCARGGGSEKPNRAVVIESFGVARGVRQLRRQ